MANVDIRQGYKNTAWFTANPTLVLEAGQVVHLEQTGTYKIGDGSTQLSALSFKGSSGGGTWGSITGTLSAQTDLQTALNAKEDTSNKQTDLTPSATKFPTVNAVIAGLNAKEDVINKDTDGTLSANSDTKYPSQKAVKTYADALVTKTSTQIIVGTGTGITSYSSLTYDSTNVVLKSGTQSSKGTSYGVQLRPFSGAEPIIFGDGSGYTALWMSTATPSSSNYLLRYNGATAAIKAASNLSLLVGNSLSIDVNANYLDFTPQSSAAGLASIFNFRPPATTGHTAGAEQIVMYVNMSTNNIQRATGAVATQRDVVIAARTHRFVAASTITNAGTFVITGAPIAGTNATITNAYSIWSQAGKVRFQGLPTSAAGLQAGDIWNNAGVLNIV